MGYRTSRPDMNKVTPRRPASRVPPPSADSRLQSATPIPPPQAPDVDADNPLSAAEKLAARAKSAAEDTKTRRGRRRKKNLTDKEEKTEGEEGREKSEEESEGKKGRGKSERRSGAKSPHGRRMDASPYFGGFPPGMLKASPESHEYYDSPYDAHLLTNGGPLSEAAKAAAAARKARKRKKEDELDDAPEVKLSLKQEKLTTSMSIRKKRDRFNGMSEDEVMARGLPDILLPNLDIVIIGINPGLMAAYIGHHYAGPGNHFWKCLYLSGLIPEPMTAYDDYKLVKFGIGFTNIVQRTTRGSADLTRKEIKDGGMILQEKIKQYKPKIAVFNGKGIYEVFCGHKNFYIGKQPEPLEGTDVVVYVMPSSSARCSQLPRAIDKVPFYIALKKLRDFLRGDTKHLDDSEVCFPDLELKVKVKNEGKDDDDRRHEYNGLMKPDFKPEYGMMPMPAPNFWAPPPPQYPCEPQFRTFDHFKQEPMPPMATNIMNSGYGPSYLPGMSLPGEYSEYRVPASSEYRVPVSTEYRVPVSTEYRVPASIDPPPAPVSNGLSSEYRLPDTNGQLYLESAGTSCMPHNVKLDKDDLPYMLPDTYRQSSPYASSVSSTDYPACSDASPLYTASTSPLSSMGNSHSPLSNNVMCNNSFMNSLNEAMPLGRASPCYIPNNVPSGFPQQPMGSLTPPMGAQQSLTASSTLPPSGVPQNYPAYPAYP